MVPSSVIQAWGSLPESHKAAITRACAKKLPPLFSRWVDAAGLKSFRRDSVVGRKAGSGPRLDAILFKAEGGQLALELLVNYFTELSPAINEECLALLEKVADDDTAGKLKAYAQIAQQYKESPLIGLYLATALWAEGFAESDLATVEALAAEPTSAS